MKTTILLMLLLANAACFSQTRDSVISTAKFGVFVTGSFDKIYDESGVVSYSVFLTYQNAQYQEVSDIAVISLKNKESVDSLIADLEGVIAYVGKKQNVKYSRSCYAVGVTDYSKSIYLYDDKDKWTAITKGQAEKLIYWLKSLKFS